MKDFVANDAFYPFLAVLFFLCILIFFRKKSLKLRMPISVIIIVISLFIEKKVTLLVSGQHKAFDADFVSLIFTTLYFSLLLNLIFSYINLFFKNKDDEKSKSITRLLKITSFIFLLMCFGERFYLSASGLITFGSVSGIVIGLASKAVLSNLISGIMLHFDRPFNIGDSVFSPQNKISGTVAKIGLRITTIINDDHKPVYIPNSLFSTLIMVNTSRAENKRILFKLSIPTDEHAKMPDFIEKTKNMLAENESISSGTEKCYIDDINQAMFSVTVSCFVERENYSTYNDIRDDVILKIITIMDSCSISFILDDSKK